MFLQLPQANADITRKQAALKKERYLSESLG